MGRELKRVALDFDWPVNKRWEGYLNPLYTAKECSCKGSGYSLKARRLQSWWYGQVNMGIEPFRPELRGSEPFTPDSPPIRAFVERQIARSPEFYGCGELAIVREGERLCAMFNTQWCHHLNHDDVAALLKSGRLMDFTHTWASGSGWKRKDPPYIPTPREVNDWSVSGGMGHDSVNSFVCIEAECERLGVSPTCVKCGGEGCLWPSLEAKAAYEAWERVEPPAGPGYQIWETVSEGSSISPVFATAHELAEHMARTKWGADEGTPFETWLAFIEGPGWAPSMVGTAGRLMTGVEGVVQLAQEQP